MWEEDPRYQETLYPLSIGLVVVSTVMVGIWSLVTDNWSILSYWIYGLGVLFLALCGYAAVVWTIGNLVLLSVKLIKRTHKRQD